MSCARERPALGALSFVREATIVDSVARHGAPSPIERRVGSQTREGEGHALYQEDANGFFQIA